MIRLLLLIPLLVSSLSAQVAQPRRLEVLFLGDDRGHNPLERYRFLKQALGPQGYNLTYTEDLGDMQREVLDGYDALVVYANHEQDVVPTAILGWVKDGGGLVALHSACGCFHPSPEWFSLVGGKFKSHEGHIFSPENIDKRHPITKDLPVLEAWDETYVHEDLSEDRHLLQVRPPINQGETKPEPWTWLRTEGKGRVFYTASGHDLRVWKEPAYQELVARAIRWAVGTQKAAMFAKYEKPELKLDEPRVRDRAHPEIPMMELQEPLTPYGSARHAQVPVGTKLELFASEPMIVNPIALDWDARGRCWVVEALGYPNDVPLDEGKGEDRIKILEDTNGDGKADKMTVFADHLRHCTGLTFHLDGVIATDGPDLVFLRDTNGDDKSDKKVVLGSGFNMGDTHASVSNLIYGMDNWAYATVGYSGVDMQVAGKPKKFGQGVFRFRPDLSDLDYLQATTNNTWGIGLQEDGSVFGSTANNNPSWMVSIPQRVYRESGMEQPRTPQLDDRPFMYPNTSDITQVDQIERYTAAAGHFFYNDTLLGNHIIPKDSAFICEPTGHLVSMGKVTDQGSIKTTNLRGQNLYASADAWSSPVYARTGPDGAVWIADWYNPIIQHNVVFRFWNPARGYDQPHSPFHTGHQNPGKGNAYVTPLRDREHGRIWRVVPQDRPVRKVPTMSTSDPLELARQLNSPSQFLRLQAQRLLIERGKEDAVPTLLSFLQMSASPEGVEAPLGAYHAVRVLANLPGEAAKNAVRDALKHADPGVRLQAAESVDLGDAESLAALAEVVMKAESPRDRLRIFTVVADAAENETLAQGLWQAVKAGQFADDYERDAASLAMLRQGGELIKAAAPELATSAGWAKDKVAWVAQRMAGHEVDPSVIAALDAVAEPDRSNLIRALGEKPTEKPKEAPLPPHLVKGKELYQKLCIECHQSDGKGVAKTFPPLFESEWVRGDMDTVARIMLGGLMGPVTVKGEDYVSAMPGHSHSTDDELAAIASYIRKAFGGLDEAPVKAEKFAELRPEVDARKFVPWTVDELKKASGK
ncbi:putative membrane-bound dehydrogenase-like protein [Haloferula luteola]|uniref:Putative membrane-bound dehydrogenase-like protein n=1 Tax=Haloferula luteola TaxID=595692 RepID=A0A840VGG5_9BACT|nr:PVC-type heme-binding CxxCH protein [Haloferula luteola]MBB5351881.1 putative membrane-bound dehydrogenase-like protein [Haloferula luteola]